MIKTQLHLLRQKFLENKVLYLSLLVAASIIVYINSSYDKSVSYMGVTETEAIPINHEKAVIIKSVLVSEGDFVRQGDLLAVLERPRLEIEITETRSELEELKSQLNLNKELNSKLKSIESVKDSEVVKSPLYIRMSGLNQKLESLKEEKEGLKLYAKVQGHIGEVNYKEGANVSPFSPIMTMHRAQPSRVKGIVHEDVYNEAGPNQKVIVEALNDPSKKVEAVITSVGSKIIPFPERFKKDVNVQVWGREIIIQIPTNNPFLLGEKVLIKNTDENITLPTEYTKGQKMFSESSQENMSKENIL